MAGIACIFPSLRLFQQGYHNRFEQESRRENDDFRLNKLRSEEGALSTKVDGRFNIYRNGG